jgi:hypothetical protein
MMRVMLYEAALADGREESRARRNVHFDRFCAVILYRDAMRKDF